MKIEWKDIYGYEGIYRISNSGMVKSLPRVSQGGANLKGKILKPYLRNNGYLYVNLFKGKIPTSFSVHSLVANHFVGERPSEKHQVNHVDFNKTNNLFTNLEWVTAKENIQHAIRNGSAHLKQNPSNRVTEIHVFKKGKLVEILHHRKNPISKSKYTYMGISSFFRGLIKTHKGCTFKRGFEV